MNKKTLSESVAYEQLVKKVYEEMLTREAANGVEVQHNVKVRGKSEVDHQIDVLLKHKVAGIEHLVIVECKHYGKRVTLEKIRALQSVAEDLSARAVMVTRKGYQSGAAEYAKHHNIVLKVLRDAVDDDFEGRLTKITLRAVAHGIVSTPEKAPNLNFKVRARDDEQRDRLLANKAEYKVEEPFTDISGRPITEPLGLWLVRMTQPHLRGPGGPYTEEFALTDHYVMRDLGCGPEAVEVAGVIVEYFVEADEPMEISTHARDVVEAVFADFHSGAVEHFAMKSRVNTKV